MFGATNAEVLQQGDPENPDIVCLQDSSQAVSFSEAASDVERLELGRVEKLLRLRVNWRFYVPIANIPVQRCNQQCQSPRKLTSVAQAGENPGSTTPTGALPIRQGAVCRLLQDNPPPSMLLSGGNLVEDEHSC